MRTPREWKVLTVTARASFPAYACTRSRISSAARLAKVTATMRDGGTCFPRIRWTMRWTSVLVLPEPAPARIRQGPSVCKTALRCWGLRPTRYGADVASTVMRSETEDLIPGRRARWGRRPRVTRRGGGRLDGAGGVSSWAPGEDGGAAEDLRPAGSCLAVGQGGLGAGVGRRGGTRGRAPRRAGATAVAFHCRPARASCVGCLPLRKRQASTAS